MTSKHNSNRIGKGIESISDSIGSESICTTKTNKIALINAFHLRKSFETSVENPSNLRVRAVILFDVIVSIIDFNLYFVEYTFSANKKLTILGIRTKHNSGSTIVFYSATTITVAKIVDSILHSFLAEQCRIFGMFEMSILHVAIIHEKGGP